MADDLAKLVIAVDATSVTPAATQLDALAAAGSRAQAATDKNTISAKQLSDALAANNNNLEKALASLNGATQAQSTLANATKATATATAASSAVAAKANQTIAQSLGALGTSATRNAAIQVEAAETVAAAETESAAVQVAAHAAVTGSSTKVRESLVLLREAANGNFTRLAGSATILAQAFNVLPQLLIGVAIAAGTVGSALLLAENQINSGVQGTGDLTKGLGLTADQLDKVKDRYVTFGDTVKATFQIIKEDLISNDLKNAFQSFWNGLAKFLEDTLVIMAGGVLGFVRVAEEAFKALPTQLGGTGTTAGLNFAKAFNSGFDTVRKNIDTNLSRVADRAREIASNRILKEAGADPSTGQNEGSLDRAKGTLQQVQDQTKAQDAYNNSLLTGQQTLAQVTKEESIDNDIKSLVIQQNKLLASSDADKRAEGQKLIPIIQQLRAAYGALYDTNINKQQLAANDNMREANNLLEKQIELAGKSNEERTVDLAQYKALQQLKKEGIDPNGAVGQQTIGLAGDNARRTIGAQRATLLNGNVDAGTSLGTNAAKVSISSDPKAYVEQQKAAYAEIDALRQQDVLSEQQAAQAKAQVDADISAKRLQIASGFFGNLASLSQSSNRTLAAIGKAAAIAQATIDGFAAVQKALAAYPPPINYIAAAGVGVAAAANVASIAGVFADGGTVTGYGGSRDDRVLIGASPGEEIINAQAAAANRPLLKQINSGQSVGKSSGMSVEIHNYGSSKIQAQQIDENRIRIIARDEDYKNTPKIMANETSNASSSFRKTLSAHTDVKRKIKS